MSKCPDLNQWKFPPWLVCICESSEGFDEAAKLLINKFGYVYSPFENPNKLNRALVLPRPDIILQDFIDRDKAFGWGIGRTRFDKSRIEHQNRGLEYDFEYFPNCPWEFMKNNPSREPMIELYRMLKPVRFLNFLGEEISFPYKV